MLSVEKTEDKNKYDNNDDFVSKAKA